MANNHNSSRLIPLFCHNNLRETLPAFAMSHSIGRANCFNGDLSRMTFLSNGMIPLEAASSCRDLDKRVML